MSIPQPPNLFVPTNDNFIPQSQIIVAVTNAVNAAVTTATNHGYQTSQWIRIIVPPKYGMTLFYVQTQIIVTGLTTFTTQIDTSALLPFVVPTFVTPGPGFTFAQAVPMSGETENIAPTVGVVPPPLPPLPPPAPSFNPPTAPLLPAQRAAL